MPDVTDNIVTYISSNTGKYFFSDLDAAYVSCGNGA